MRFCVTFCTQRSNFYCLRQPGETMSMEEEIIEALNEWPVTNSVYDQTSPLDKIHNPHSVSTFFLRNVGKKAKEKEKEKEKAHEDAASEAVYRPEVLAHVALSKWWRSDVSADVRNSVSLPDTSSPHTKISCIAKSEPGSDFIHDEIKRLRDKIAGGCKQDDVFSALASYYELTGNLNLAILHLETAIDKSPQDKEYKWRLLRLKKQHQIRSAQEEVLKRISFGSASVEKTMPVPKQIRSVSGEQLSFEEFFYNYSLTNTPVVITGVAEKMFTVPWTMQHIKDMAGHQKVKLKSCVKESVQWARLEETKEKSVGDFIDGLEDDSHAPDPLYLFDWNLPCHCPELVKELVIPKYFSDFLQRTSPKSLYRDSWPRLFIAPAGFTRDFLQRTSPKSLYRDSWPSLFIAPAGLNSELHVDSFGSNFWMALIEGKKRWLLFEPKDVPLLYPSFGHPWTSDPVFDVDLASPDFQTFPLLSETQPLECILEPGELLFVPAGCPHRVENLEKSLAISGNFVDLSNFDLVKSELHTTGIMHERSASLYKQFSSKDFKSSMKSSPEDLPWEKFKSWAPEDYDQYNITEDSVRLRKPTKSGSLTN